MMMTKRIQITKKIRWKFRYKPQRVSPKLERKASRNLKKVRYYPEVARKIETRNRLLSGLKPPDGPNQINVTTSLIPTHPLSHSTQSPDLLSSPLREVSGEHLRKPCR